MTNIEIGDAISMSPNAVTDGIMECVNNGVLKKTRSTHGHTYAMAFDEVVVVSEKAVSELSAIKKVSQGNRKLSPQQLMVGTLSRVMQMNIRMNNGRLVKLASQLIMSGYTSEVVEKIYGKGGVYWSQDWRGKNCQIPTEAAIRETVERFSRMIEESEVEMKNKSEIVGDNESGFNF